METFDVVKILGYGLSGLAFLLLFMAYNLISKEQKRSRPRKEILSTIRMFMVLVLLCITVVGFFGLPALRNNQLLRVDNEILKVDKYWMNTLYTMQENNRVLEEKGESLDQNEIQKIVENSAQQIDTLAKALSKLDPEKEKQYLRLEKDLLQKADQLENRRRPLSDRKKRQLIQEVQKINTEIEQVLEEKAKSKLSPQP